LTRINDVLTGIDVLERDSFTALRGARVGLVTNHTGLTADGRSSISVLHHAPHVELVALFGPEHGIAGAFDEEIGHAVHPETGLPVYSLYGKSYKPSVEQLAGIDTLVFDIQDIGCRFYTYISTLCHVMEAAAEHGLHIVVLDRPNPITGTHVEGPLADPDKLNFTAVHPIAIRHGMTVGELARLFKAERSLGCDLAIILCEGWRRNDWFDATGLTWVNPSPNMRSLTQATLYPGVGLLEFTNVSVGRGTDTPFEVVGAPFVDGRMLAAELNGMALPGVRFIPISFTPTRSVHEGARCGGINVLVTDREALSAVQVGFALAIALRRLWPGAYEHEKLTTLLANDEAYQAYVGGAGYQEIEEGWADELRAFQVRRDAHLLYA
jgi:uncharacterized protein YbbC (DUF1343 family)